MQNSYEKRINRSAKRSAKAAGIFSKIEQQLSAEAQLQREVHDLLAAERREAVERYREAKKALAEAQVEKDTSLSQLQAKAAHHGLRAQSQAQKLRELFI